jgi:hypothetical protein
MFNLIHLGFRSHTRCDNKQQHQMRCQMDKEMKINKYFTGDILKNTLCVFLASEMISHEITAFELSLEKKKKKA